jgi:FkbM family methyltransferase
MKDIFISPASPLRKIFPVVRKLRQWAWKFHDRAGRRLVISGGPVPFMDVVLEFPEKVALTYSTPLFWNGPDSYESPTSRTLALLAGRAKSFLDIGSNMGIYAVYVGVKFPEVKVFAFEPVPSIWEKNCQFHRANGLAADRVHNLAVSDREGPQTIVLPIGIGGLEEEQTATLRTDIWQDQSAKVEKFEIQCVTLDSFAKKNPLPAGLCCVKIDVENFEAAVFRGARTFLTAARPWIVCEILPSQEVDPVTQARRNNNDDVVAQIQELNYVPFAIMADGFFRMTAADFVRPRPFKDFLLVPAERLTAEHSYLSAATLLELVSTR